MLLQLGDKGDNVKYLQYGLHILCCSPNGFDGEFGNGTLTAVKKFQSKYGLVSDGIVGDYTWNRLKDEITSIQYQLNNKGFNVGTADGYYGNGTRTAVINFQTARGLDIDGEVGTNTWNTLFNTFNSVANTSISPVGMLGFLDDLSATFPLTATTYSEPNFSALAKASAFTSVSNII